MLKLAVKLMHRSTSSRNLIRLRNLSLKRPMLREISQHLDLPLMTKRTPDRN